VTEPFIYQPPDLSWPRLLYQDKDVLVVDKPSGLLSNPGKGAALADCVLSRLQQQFDSIYLIHRLDLATSGLMVFAKRRKAEAELKQQFATRRVSKTYLAVVAGCPLQPVGSLNWPLAADPGQPPKNKVCLNHGKAALTHYRQLWSNGERTLLQLKPITGRSHQLRVHLQTLGHAILGDTLYAEPAIVQQADRLLLHACALSFYQPYSGELLSFSLLPDWQAYDIPPITLQPWPAQFTEQRGLSDR
jgi:tRNA pseudouridine32 synthase/23S rRNA pseudouridine746 synthase